MLRQGLRILLPALAVPFLVVAALFVYTAIANAGTTEPESSPQLVFRAGREHPVTQTMKKAAGDLGGLAAPSFSAVDADGETRTLASSTNGKPLVLFFIELQCPCCKGAKTFVDRIAETYGDVCNVAGVINADRDLAKAWTMAVRPKFAVLCDPEMRTIRAFQAQRGVYTTLVGADGRIDKAYPGYSRDMLRDIARRIERAAGISKRRMQVDDAPKVLTSGCLFPGAKVSVDQL